MEKQLPVIPWTATIFMIVVVQAIALVMLVTSFFSLGASSVASIAQLPPVTFIYSAADTGWIGAGRVIAHGVCAVANIAVGWLCFSYAMSRRLKMIRYITFAMAVQFWFSAACNIALAGLISAGGWWHAASFVLTTLMALAATTTAVIFTVLAAQLRQLGIAHDSYIGEQVDL